MYRHICNLVLLAVVVLSAIAIPVVTSHAQARTHYVQMRNAKSDDPQTINVFEPAILHIQKGDTVVFLPVDKGHNTASKKGMIPHGTKRWNSRLDEEFSITFDIDGTYGYVCVPHVQMGMVGLILVGDYRQNIKEAQEVRQGGRARKAFKQLFAGIKAEKTE